MPALKGFSLINTEMLNISSGKTGNLYKTILTEKTQISKTPKRFFLL